MPNWIRNKLYVSGAASAIEAFALQNRLVSDDGNVLEPWGRNRATPTHHRCAGVLDRAADSAILPHLAPV